MIKVSHKKWIDVSVPIKSNMVHWPSDPSVTIKRTKNMDQGDRCNVSHLSMGSHTATHMDAPLHFLRDGKSLDQMPLAATIGEARVIEIKDPESIKPQELKKYKIRRGERILFKTRNSFRSWNLAEFDKNFVYVSKEAAAYLAKIRVQTVGVDYLSVGGFYKDGLETHHALLGAGIWIIEGMDLSKVKAGRYQLICLPLKILNSDGAPARAVLSAV